MIKKISYTLITLGLLLAILYSLIPTLASKIINQQLLAAGIVSESTVQHPTYDTFEIKHLALKNSGDNLEFDTQAKNIFITYDFYDLLLKQRIKAVNISELDINLYKFKPNNTDQQQGLDLHQLLSQQWFSNLPFTRINVDKLNIQWKIKPGKTININGRVSLNKQALSATLSYSENTKAFATGRINFNKDNQLEIALKTSKPGLNYQLQSTLKPLADQKRIQINLTQNLGFEQFFPNSIWLESKLTENIREVLADIKGNFSITTELTGDTNFSSVQSWLSTATIHNQFKSNVSAANINISTPDIQTSIDQIKLDIAGHINWLDKKLTLKMATASNARFEKLETSVRTANTKPKNGSLAMSNDNHAHQNKISNTIKATALQLTLDSTFFATWNEPLTSNWNNINVEDFSNSITSKNVQSNYGSLQHQPIKLDISSINTKNRSFNIKYQIDDLIFKTNQTLELKPTTPLAFQSISTHLKGAADINRQKITVTLDNNTPLTIQNIRTPQVSSPTLRLNTQSPLTLSLLLNEQKMEVLLSDIALSVEPSQWQHPLGSAETQSISLDIDDIDLDSQSAAIHFAFENLLLKPNKKISRLLKLKQTPFKQIKITANGKLEMAPKQLKLKLEKGLQLGVNKVRLPSLRSHHINIKTSAPLSLTAALPSDNATFELNTIKVNPINFTLTSYPLYIDNHKIQFQYVNAQIKNLNLSPFSGSANTRIKKLQIPSLAMHGKHLENINVNAYHRTGNSGYTGDFNITSKQFPIDIKAAVIASRSFETIKANWQLASIELIEHTASIKPFFASIWPKNLEITNGKYSQSGKASIKNREVSAMIDHKLTALSFVKDNLSLQNLSVSSVSRYSKNQLTQRGSIKVGSINTAVSAKNISAQFSLDNLLKDDKSIIVSNLKAKLLGADIYLNRISTRIQSPLGSAVLRFKNLPLNNVLALENQPSLTGSGMLQGELPFRFKGDKIWITNGKIKNKSTGYIRYQANPGVTELAQTNTGLNIALNVLENFHYNTLSVNANYTPDGKLILENKLAGSNPLWQQGQPIEFSINIQENILQLFKALNFSQNLTDNIQEKLQQ